VVQATVHEVRDKVRTAYSAAAERPAERHPFPVGRAFAESLGYPAALLDSLPSVAVEAFAGVSMGCGAGLDSLIAARRVGLRGKVTGVDFSDAMLARAREAASDSGIENVSFEKADAERLPLSSASIDVALVNGIFNLNPTRDSIFRELARVLRPDGVAYAAELILAKPLPSDVKQNEVNSEPLDFGRSD
jgi:arsenite methyltransferase